MSPQFQFQVGPFSFSVATDATGIQMSRGSITKHFTWDSIAGALLVRPEPADGDSDGRDLANAKRFLGPSFDVEKLKGLRDSMATIHIAYREKGRRVTHEEIPFPISDGGFLEEFQTRLGARWLGEAADSRAAERKLHTAPGVVKILGFLFLFLAALVIALAFGLFTLFAPVLNILSIRQMYEDFSDGDYASFGTRLLVYVALFIFAHLLRKAWRARMEARRASRWPRS